MEDPLQDRINEILCQTTANVKHSSATFKKIKDKMLHYEKQILTPTPQIKTWFDARSINYTLPDFFDALFSEAAKYNCLNYIDKTIMFDKDDAVLFGFPVGAPVCIYRIFENIPNYFN